MILSDEDIKKFSRQLILDGFSEEKQKKILTTHITFIGMGGVNIPAAIYLLSAGIKNISIIDYDKVSYSNLNRQNIFSKKDIGKYKIQCAESYFKKQYSKINVTSYKNKINKKNCNKLLKNTDIVIDGSDNWETMLCINDYCSKNNLPLASASVTGFDGNLIFFENSKQNKHLCLRCIFPIEKQVELPRCETVGILGTSAGIIGVLSAHKIIRYLVFGFDSKNDSNIFYFSGKNLAFNQIKIKHDPNCKLLKK